MKIIILNLLVLKFSALIIAASQCRALKLCLTNQKYFANVPGQGKCNILLEQFYSFHHSTRAKSACKEKLANISFIQSKAMKIIESLQNCEPLQETNDTNRYHFCNLASVFFFILHIGSPAVSLWCIVYCLSLMVTMPSQTTRNKRNILFLVFFKNFINDYNFKYQWSVHDRNNKGTCLFSVF